MKNLYYCIIATLLLAGCQTSTPEKDNAADMGIILPPSTDVTASSSISGKIVFEDHKIRIEGTDKDGITSIRVANTNEFDIRDMAAFTITTYRSQLQRKLQDGAPLTDFDVAVLTFIWQSQMKALKTFTLKGCAAVMDRPVTLSPTPAFENDLKKRATSPSRITMRDCIDKSVAVFINNNNALSKGIDAWGRGFNSIDQTTKEADLIRIVEGNRRTIDQTQWRQYFAFAVSEKCINIPSDYRTCFYPNRYTGLGENKDLRVYKKYSMKKETASRQWHNLISNFEFYVDDCKTIYDGTAAYLKKTTDSNSKRQIEDLRLNMENDLQDETSQFRAVFCDFPFAMACYKTYVTVQSRKGIFNDDEEAMKQDALDFSCYVSGTDMLKQISSPFSASLYTDLLALLKSELGDKRWKSLLTTCKLYESDGIAFTESLFKENTLTASSHLAASK